MPPKAPSSTTSSKSATSKAISLDTSVQYLKGVGPRLSVVLEGKDIRTIRDVLYFLPRDYQDRSKLVKLNALKADEPALVHATVISHRFIPIRSRSRPMLEAIVDDGTARIGIKWFAYNRTYMEKLLSEKPKILLYGTPKFYSGKLGMIHPEIEWDVDESELTSAGGIVPVYSESEGLTQRTIRKIVDQAIDLVLPSIAEDLPSDVLKAHQLMPIREALLGLHRPHKEMKIEDLRSVNTPEQKRLIFDELFRFEWIIGRRRLNLRREYTKPYPSKDAQGLLKEMTGRLPFALTGDQGKSIDKIFEDLSEDKPMNRLLQGDVGCGKTLVAFASCLPVIAGGGQIALMAPTEILADQHAANAARYLDGLLVPEIKGVRAKRFLRIGSLTGSTKKSERDRILEELKNGEIDVLIGTHALIEDPVVFRELGLVIVDEQHRFGVDQRMKLRSKGKNPHVLSMTATPIPRTLALTAFGDLDVTTIRELPKGRPDIHTKIFRESEHEAAHAIIVGEIKKGRQAYIIFPLVEESEKIDLANAVQGAEELANGPLKGYRVGLLHGRLRPQEKTDVMDAFKRGEIKALVSTTVVEVGVDVPNSTVLMIENAERFGLSQLHQLRGRIGRGTETSYCILMNAGGGEVSYERLKAMEKTRDGFKLAELDLEIRGPGEFLGTRQSGELQFKFADLMRDQFLLHEARTAAFDLLKTDPDLEKPEHAPLRRYMEKTGHLQTSRFATA